MDQNLCDIELDIKHLKIKINFKTVLSICVSTNRKTVEKISTEF